jgi:hypothetical protein
VAKDGRGFDAGGQPFVPLGVNYYRPGTGWAPQVWKKFDPAATREDFARMKSVGVNCVRVFLSYGSFYSKPGVLNPDGLRKFDEFLAIAESFGIYVHPTGPDHWEGMPEWTPVAIEDETTLQALESFWRLFASRYRGRSVIFAYDLKNEPELAWDSPTLRRKWNDWLRQKYSSSEAVRIAWRKGAVADLGSVAAPEPKDALLDPALLDYQRFREEVAEEWTRRQVQAIKSIDRSAMVTVGLIQWSLPVVLPGSIKYYSAFRPSGQARYLDFMEFHFYPLAKGAYEYRGEAETAANLAYAECLAREVAREGKPVVLAEFGWYGGGRPRFDGGKHPAATEQQQADYCRRVVEITAGWVCGWLNWGFYDQPEATDCSQLTGLFTSGGHMKEWGNAFSQLSIRFSGRQPLPPKDVIRPDLDWNVCLTSTAAAEQFRLKYLQAFLRDQSAR